MRLLFRSALASMLAAALLFPARPASAADIGDGTLGCYQGEICFTYIYVYGWVIDGSQVPYGIKHFYYGDMDHSNNVFHNGISLMDNIQGYYNFDTRCSIKMWDVLLSGAWIVYKTLPRSTGNIYLDMGMQDSTSFSARDINNGHSRC